jgi:hypothetical protein
MERAAEAPRGRAAEAGPRPGRAPPHRLSLHVMTTELTRLARFEPLLGRDKPRIHDRDRAPWDWYPERCPCEVRPISSSALEDALQGHALQCPLATNRVHQGRNPLQGHALQRPLVTQSRLAARSRV